MNQVTVGILGFLTIIAIVVTLFKSKTLPSIAFILFPSILALILVFGGYYTFKDVASLIKDGFKSTGPTAALFVFSVGVTVMLAIIAIISHFDGGGASTFLIVVPAMLPVYKKMHMRKTSLLRIAVLAMGVLNLMPWAGPTMRAASVLGMEAGQLWNKLLPIQVFGIVLALAHAVLTGIQEKARGAGLNGKLAQTEEAVEVEAGQEGQLGELARPKLFFFNMILTIAVIAMLIWDVFPSYVPFMLGVGISILVNYTDIKLQKKVLNSHAVPALMMCTTLMGAALLMGILVKTVKVDDVAIPSVVSCMSALITMVLPAALGAHLPLVIGILSVPLALAFDTDSYFYGMLPVMISIGEGFGIPALPIAISMAVCRNCATFISPMVPATLLGVGLAEVDIKDHIRASFFYVWGFSFLCMIFAILVGIIPA